MWISSCFSIIGWNDFSPIGLFRLVVKNQIIINVRIYFCSLNSILLICMYGLVLLPLCLSFCNFIIGFEIQKNGFSNFLLLIQDFFGYPDTCIFILISGLPCQFLKKPVGNLVMITLNL